MHSSYNQSIRPPRLQEYTTKAKKSVCKCKDSIGNSHFQAAALEEPSGKRINTTSGDMDSLFNG
jgi:hypothetical protein